MSKQSLLDYWKQDKIVTDKRILEAFKEIPRENFVPKEYKDEAYSDYPLPLDHNQTISQPTTVAMMTQFLEPKPNQKILEIGAGSGYQAAILSHIVGSKGKIITTEIIPELAQTAKNNLKKYKNVQIIHHDGSKGYRKQAPYDRIILTAACRQIPKPLIQQLKENGIILAPTGSFFMQIMVKGIKKKNKLETQDLGYFAFVPLTGKHA